MERRKFLGATGATALMPQGAQAAPEEFPADGRMTPIARSARQDNYHPPRQLMLSILALDRMIQRGGRLAKR